MLLPLYARGRGVMRQNTIEREKGGCRRHRNSWAPPFIPVISRARRRCVFKERVSLEELPSAISSLTHLTDIANFCSLKAGPFVLHSVLAPVLGLPLNPKTAAEAERILIGFGRAKIIYKGYHTEQDKTIECPLFLYEWGFQPCFEDL
ncbi:hypothetical protein HN51_044347 [Arachis hypogaea]